LISLFYVSLQADAYTSESKLTSSSSKSSSSSRAVGLAAQFGVLIPGGGQSETNWIYPEIIKSRKLAKKLLALKFKIDKNTSEKKLINILVPQKIQNQRPFHIIEEIASRKLRNMIEVSKNIKSGIYTLRITTRVPSFSYQLNNALILELDNLQKSYNKSETMKARLFIEERIIEIKKELNQAEEKLKNFITRNRRMDNSPLLTLEKDRLDREVILLNGIFTTLKQQLETTKIEEVKDSRYISIIDPPSIPIEASGPSKVFLVVISTILSFIFISLYVLFVDYIKNSNQHVKLQISQAKNHLKNLFKYP